MLTFSVTHSCHCEGNGGEGGGEVSKLMHRATELRSFVTSWRCVACGGGRRVAGKGDAGACRNEGRFSVWDCWKAGAKGWGVGGLCRRGGRSCGGRESRAAALVGPVRLFCFVFLLSQIEFGSAHSFSLRRPFLTPPTSHCPALYEGPKNKNKKKTQISMREDSDTPWHPPLHVNQSKR